MSMLDASDIKSYQVGFKDGIKFSVKLTSPREGQLSLLIGTTMGQISELLNSIKRSDITISEIYKGLLDIHNQAALQIHELFYKDNKPDEETESLLNKASEKFKW